MIQWNYKLGHECEDGSKVLIDKGPDSNFLYLLLMFFASYCPYPAVCVINLRCRYEENSKKEVQKLRNVIFH